MPGTPTQERAGDTERCFTIRGQTKEERVYEGTKHLVQTKLRCPQKTFRGGNTVSTHAEEPKSDPQVKRGELWGGEGAVSKKREKPGKGGGGVSTVRERHSQGTAKWFG